MEKNLNQPRNWYDKKRFVLPLLLFIFPVGVYFLWKSNGFSKEGKVGLSIAFTLFFFMYVAGSLLEPSKQNNQAVDNNLPERVEMEAQEGTVQFDNSGEEVGRTEEEAGVEINMTKISEEFFRGEKAVFEFRLSDRANKNQLISIANIVKEDHPGYKRYFIGYYLPNQKVGKGAWATSHFDPDLQIRILGLSKSESDNLKNTEVNFKGKKVGKWLVTMGTLSNVAVISKLENGKYLFTDVYKDGSSGEKELTKKGNKYIYENDFGEYFEIEKTGKLAHYSENGKFAEYEKVE
jgi:hypothetical protein